MKISGAETWTPSQYFEDTPVFAQISRILYTNREFCELGIGAQRLFICMVMESKDCEQFSFSKGLAEKKYHIPPSSFERYRRKLICAEAIILCTDQADNAGKTGCQANRYRISPKWMKEVSVTGNQEERRANVSMNLTVEQVFAINMALAKGQRIEIIPLKDRIKVVAVKRDELKTK